MEMKLKIAEVVKDLKDFNVVVVDMVDTRGQMIATMQKGDFEKVKDGQEFTARIKFKIAIKEVEKGYFKKIQRISIHLL